MDESGPGSDVAEPLRVSRRHKKGLGTRYPTDNTSTHRYSTAKLPAPESRSLGDMGHTTGYMSPGNILGQFSYAPATQTTVVTTTTTTTTKFPPFVMPTPKRLEDLDPKVYPLASTSTPECLRTISFESDGKTTIFHEFEDSKMLLEQTERTNDSYETQRHFLNAMTDSGGRVLRSPGRKPNSDRLHDQAWTTDGTLSPEPTRQPAESTTSTIHDIGGHFADSVNISSKGRTQKKGSKRRSLSKLQIVPNGDPITPYTDSQSTGLSSSQAYEQTKAHRVGETLSLKRKLEQQETPSTQNSKHNDHGESLAASSQEFITPPLPRLPTFTNLPTAPTTSVPTPPIQEDDSNIISRSFSRRHLSSVPSRLSTVESSASGQDGSLPSPSLSPVTGAAHLHGTDFDADESASERASFMDQDGAEEGFSFNDTPSRRSFVDLYPHHGSHLPENHPSNATSIQDFSAIIESFERLPDQLKSYVMHQMLRRCPKPTLHLVADVVNPALKCDFLGMLPNELSQHIVSYLDVKSMCRASQVSKKWRNTINSAEEPWKKLFDDDGFNLPSGELERAIAEGWGWQDPYSPDGWERDISTMSLLKSDTDGSSSSLAQFVNQSRAGSAGPTMKRSKRKAVSRLTNKSKKRRCNPPSTSESNQLFDWSSLLESAKGPFNAGTAAALAVPSPKEGLSSLRSLHLYKSLYRRHFLVRKSWMDDVNPRHIAFRAHDRHVVTCLQFDTDKILTGSDDTNINVYDTKTGALRTRLRGHEGGVWALQYDGNILVSGSTDRSVRVWDIEKGEQMQVFHGHTSTVRCLQILQPTKVGETDKGVPIMLPSQPLIITGSRDSNLRVWRLPQPGDARYFQAGPPADDSDCRYFVRMLTGHTHSVRAIAAHADTLVSGSYDCTVRVWKISTGETTHRLTGHTQKVYSVVLDYKRNRCISGSMDNLVKIWSLDTGSPLYTLDGHSSLVGLLDLNSDRLVSAAADSTLRIWDPENGQCKATLSAHTGAITCFQHDGQKVISGSDRTLKMWNVKTGECVKDLLTDLSGVWQVNFNERRCVAAVQRDNLTYIEVLDFGASRDGVPEDQRGRRIVVNVEGREMVEGDLVSLNEAAD